MGMGKNPGCTAQIMPKRSFHSETPENGQRSITLRHDYKPPHATGRQKIPYRGVGVSPIRPAVFRHASQDTRETLAPGQHTQDAQNAPHGTPRACAYPTHRGQWVNQTPLAMVVCPRRGVGRRTVSAWQWIQVETMVVESHGRNGPPCKLHANRAGQCCAQARRRKALGTPAA